MWQAKYDDDEWVNVDEKRAERIIRDNYKPADEIIAQAKSDPSFIIRTIFAYYRWIA